MWYLDTTFGCWGSKKWYPSTTYWYFDTTFWEILGISENAEKRIFLLIKELFVLLQVYGETLVRKNSDAF